MGTSAQAHLMVAQHGTLNFLDDSVYMVLSLPASAFSDADENSDDQLSLVEFTEHRTDLIDAVTENVTLSNNAGNLQLNEIMISPVTPHDAPKEPADQVIVMGRFALDDEEDNLQFHIGLFGKQANFQTLEITATRKKENQKQVFELSPNANEVELTFN